MTRKFVFICALAVALFTAGCSIKSTATNRLPPGVYIAPQITLTDQDGKPFDSSKYFGKVIVLNFIYTRCPDVCPLQTARMKELQDRLAANDVLGNYIVMASVTVDPENDTPAVLKEYAKKFGADTRTWSFLTGTREEIDRVLAGYYVGAKPQEIAMQTQTTHSESLLAHSSKTSLINKAGYVEKEFFGNDFLLDQLVRDVLLLLGEG